MFFLLAFFLPGVFKLTSSIWKTSLIFPIVFQTKLPQLMEDVLVSCYVTELSSTLCKIDNMWFFFSLSKIFCTKILYGEINTENQILKTLPDTCNRPRNEIIISWPPQATFCLPQCKEIRSRERYLFFVCYSCDEEH